MIGRRARIGRLAAPAMLAPMLLLAGCGTTERSGLVGEMFDANGVAATVARVDTSPPVPAEDITGLSLPAAGTKLVGARVNVCSDHGGAITSAAFGIETTDGRSGTVKNTARNYPDAYGTVRDGCDDGWIVFEIDRGAEPETISFGFTDTGSAYEQQDQVDARFSWSVG